MPAGVPGLRRQNGLLRLSLRIRIRHGKGGHELNSEEHAPKAEDLARRILSVTKDAGVPGGFLRDLLIAEPGDWSFVIKAHALLESVVCQLISAELKRPEMLSVLPREVQRRHPLRRANECL